jgi:hypothetical protein
MLKDGNWRVRKQIGRSMPAVVKHISVDYFTEHLLTDFLPLLKDGVDEVRVEMANILPLFISSASSVWFFEKIYPSVKSMSEEDFLVRLCLLTTLQGLLLLNDLTDNHQTEVLDLLVHSSKDKVPNIRLRAAQVMGYVASNKKSDAVLAKFKSVLGELSQDKDKDVKYFAETSLKKC